MLAGAFGIQDTH